jgi:hypothetical protein
VGVIEAVSSFVFPVSTASDERETAFGTPRAPQREKPPYNVHHVHPTFAFMEISGERCVFRFFITFTLFTTFTFQ